jgi:hypothetical protein
MIKFTSTFLKPAGDPKPARNQVGADTGCNFSPTGVATNEFLSNLPQTHPVVIPGWGRFLMM